MVQPVHPVPWVPLAPMALLVPPALRDPLVSLERTVVTVSPVLLVHPVPRVSLVPLVNLVPPDPPVVRVTKVPPERRAMLASTVCP